MNTLYILLLCLILLSCSVDSEIATTNEDTAVNIAVLTNVTDPDSDSLTATQPTSGSVAMNLDGTITSTPNANTDGVDSFTYDTNDVSATTGKAVSLPLPAFPGAEGYGAQSIGGRGGDVIEVRNLNDSGPGSLRAAVEAEGPRIVVFRVGGTIELLSSIEITNPYITIAGQTAPGGGIAIRTHPTMDDAPIYVSTQHVIIRYIRARPGPSTELSQNIDALIIGREAKHIIVDHCSFSWSTDETISIWYDASDITIQWSIISEALLNSTHNAGPQGYGVLIGDQSTRISFHHNLLAHNHGRNPRATNGDIDLVNNVIYNPGSTPSRLFGDAINGNVASDRFNYVGNYIKPGPDSTFDYEVKLESNDGSAFSTFLANNIGPNRPDETVPDQEIVHPDGRGFIVDTRFDAPFVTTYTALDAYDHVLASAGATLPLRDPVDERIINEVVSSSGKIIDDPSEVGGWPYLDSGIPSADSDHDGMPDTWENLYGFNPYDPTDGPKDANADGYTNIEEFLNGTSPNSEGNRTFVPILLGKS